MKLALAGVLGGLQSLSHDDFRERPVDRLGAAGMIGRGRAAAMAAQSERATSAERESILCSLGVELIRFKFSNIPAARLDAEDLLAIALIWRPKLNLSGRERTRVARWAVQEWASDLCPPRPEGCGGAKEVPDHDVKHLEGHQPMRVCPVCSGTGLRRYRDEERIKALGAAFAAAMSEAHEFIGSAQALALSRAKKSLERDLTR